MLVQVLAEYADRYLAGQLNDSAWESRRVPWLIEISKQGKFLRTTSHIRTETRGDHSRTVEMELKIPRSPVKRNSGEHPLLAADDIAYVLGSGPWTPDRGTERRKADRHHRAFVGLIERAARETQESALESCERFYRDPAEVDKARKALARVKPGTLIALSAGGPLVELDAVRAWWRKHYERERAEDIGSNVGECLVSGVTGPIAPTHQPIKGLANLGGQPSGVALMSFGKPAFRSYGWEQNANSPVSDNRALAYVLALNDLLRQSGSASRVPGSEGKKRRNDKAGIGFVFWTREPSHHDIFNALDPPNGATLDAMLNLKDEVPLDANQFYMAGLSGNGGRLRVRYWVADSLARVQSNVTEWHRQLRVAWPWEHPSSVRLWQLEKILSRDGEPPPHLEIALLRRAIEGRAQPLGYATLSTVLNRLRRPGAGGRRETRTKESRPLASLRAAVGLVRLCINDLRHTRKESEMSEGLDPNCMLPAYLCGRLMFEYENLQKAASGSANSSVLDRYFTLASTYPAIAIPRVADLGQKHLRKLRFDKPGVAFRIDERLQEIHSRLAPSVAGAYPARLSLEDQGLFILGYYHQKAENVRQIQAAKRAYIQNESALSGKTEES
jgi:CRISPR-associated protein Csd1